MTPLTDIEKTEHVSEKKTTHLNYVDNKAPTTFVEKTTTLADVAKTTPLTEKKI